MNDYSWMKPGVMAITIPSKADGYNDNPEYTGTVVQILSEPFVCYDGDLSVIVDGLPPEVYAVSCLVLKPYHDSPDWEKMSKEDAHHFEFMDEDA